ncbi:MAG TPA: polyphenol oxidase family protein [Leptospiraceae bacterium]|nr:polyphenol oxidase family protein [Leptospiraceae bacterium]HMW05494.1 polyphenol oxidase family protein [Leptospiraceae bacterium]HMX32479.1 polyphenol oxidase family protein [Leptospiraceae bacterium]HMY31004.1 polyphenol oxidase family protein [Leptospiraceae bacterium]HMZ64382.1 polyphenol oxidase family protein [Leptospiraceae bacterium]
MIEKKIQTKNNEEVRIYVLGKKETEQLEGVPKENLAVEIQNLIHSRFSFPKNKIFLLDQTHSDLFYNTNQIRPNQEGDALYSCNLEEILVVKTADCMPLFFWSETERLIGIIHSGWKGTDLGISEKLFKFLKSKGHKIESIQGFLGPCARKKNYEVGHDLFERFSLYAPSAIEPKENGKYSLGIDLVLKKRLQENLIDILLEDSEICTIENTEYHSHRRKDTGRNLNIIYRRG